MLKNAAFVESSLGMRDGAMRGWPPDRQGAAASTSSQEQPSGRKGKQCAKFNNEIRIQGFISLPAS